jgi:hypothetical protein
MDFFIKKNATLPVLKMQVVKDGRSDYQNFMNLMEVSSFAFSMINLDTGIPKIVSRPAYIVEKTFIEPQAEPEYYVYYQFRAIDTKTPGRYKGEFLMKSDEGNLLLPLRDELYINILDSFSSVEPCC